MFLVTQISLKLILKENKFPVKSSKYKRGLRDHYAQKEKRGEKIHLLIEMERFQICVGNLSAPANVLIIKLTIITR